MNIRRIAWVGALCGALTLPGVCVAQDIQDMVKAQAAKYEELCRARAKGAREMMKYRQAGGSAVDMLQRFQAHSARNPAQASVGLEYEKMLEDAFTVPRYYSDETRARAISEFENAAFIACRRKYRSSLGGN